jgi:signal transduction histidine kinase
MERTTASPKERGWHAAVAVVALAAAPNLWATLTRFDAFDPYRLTAWWALYAVFAVAFAACAWWAIPRRSTNAIAALLAVQTLAALGANWLIPTVIPGVATGGALLVVVASQLSRLPTKVATPWVLVQHAALLGIYLASWATSIAIVAGVAFLVFSFVLLTMERLLVRERAVRLQLAQTLAELTAARQSLEAQARDGERLRIARDLHDLLGHHLVALSLQLQLAERSDPEQARRTIERASSLTRLLLGDLRAVVADLREPVPVDLVAELESLREDDGPPRVVVQTLARGLRLDGSVAETLLRAGQELVTNARKHARAEEIVVHLGDGELCVSDDGTGGPIREGTGLQGLRERLSLIRGALQVEHPGRGTRVRVRFPVSETSEVGP